MRLIRHATVAEYGKRIRMETHEYESMEECESYMKMWEKAGFNGACVYGTVKPKALYVRVIDL